MPQLAKRAENGMTMPKNFMAHFTYRTACPLWKISAYAPGPTLFLSVIDSSLTHLISYKNRNSPQLNFE